MFFNPFKRFKEIDHDLVSLKKCFQETQRYYDWNTHNTCDIHQVIRLILDHLDLQIKEGRDFLEKKNK